MPPEIGSLLNLLDLRLFNNNLADAIPYQLSYLKKVRHVDLGFNYFTNPDNSQFQVMPSLVNLSLTLNSLDNEFGLHPPMPESDLPRPLPQ
ncbi:hypothetical protein HPP92_009623 [Vanilla planifolia]|uniref:Uncharacterized protein n=1 Tax=Vanilla planifolia TaxID=51239 RepID=A0A835RBV8_VANPL|nr:hypothetical protein HPP92_009623 [Vanilla planifolia]